MKIIVREVASDDWKAIYFNDDKVLEDHHIEINDICEELQSLINDEFPIDFIKGEHYYLDDIYAEEYGFPDKFSDIPDEMI